MLQGRYHIPLPFKDATLSSRGTILQRRDQRQGGLPCPLLGSSVAWVALTQAIRAEGAEGCKCPCNLMARSAQARLPAGDLHFCSASMCGQMSMCGGQGLCERDSVQPRDSVAVETLMLPCEGVKCLLLTPDPYRLVLCPEWPGQGTMAAEKAEVLVSRASQLCPGFAH